MTDSTTAEGPALRLAGVSKHYAGHTAVDDLSLQVPRGTVHGLLGPNGAGKSSTLRMIMNIILRDGGELEILGRDPERDRDVLRSVGYLPEERGLYQRMTVRETVAFFGRLKGLGRGEAAGRGEEWLDRLGLAKWADERVEALSKGMQQKVQLVTTLLHDPEVLILDEPQAGLDPVNQELLANTIRAARERGRTVVLSTHNMAQAEELCDEVTLIAAGRTVLEGSLERLRGEHRSDRYRLRLDGDGDGGHAEDRMADLRQAAGLVQSLEALRGGLWEVELRPGRTASDLLQAALRHDLEIARFERVEPTLHEMFLQHVGAVASRPDRKEVRSA